jgi:TRAP-type C4-dicarboxylate transport system permease small subunit
MDAAPSAARADEPGPIMAIWNVVERAVIGICGLCALVVACYGVLTRYLSPQLAVDWGDEVVVYFIVWAVFLVSSQLVRTDGHVRPDIVLRLVPPGGQRVLEVLNCLAAIAFCAGLTYLGIEIAYGSYDIGETSISALQFPMWIYYSALPVGGALMLVRYVIRLYRYIFRFDPATMTIFQRHV